MSQKTKTRVAILLVISMLLSGCTQPTGLLEEPMPIDDVPGCMDENASNYNPHATVPDSSCTYPEPEPDVILASQSEFCDDVNPHHCMLPFPAPAFLVDYEATATG